jgi:ribonuclease BN (tRNA processing enzyme)
VQVTVLGSCAAWPEAGRACGGFLVEDGDRRLVIDLGYGTLPYLLAAAPADRLDAVIVTHAHPDHFADLHALFRARYYGHRGTGLPALPVYAPARVPEVLAPLEADGDEHLLGEVLEFHELPPGADFTLRGLRVDTVALPHWVPDAGVRVTGTDGAVFAYTGDTGPAPEVAELGAGADLFAVEATFQGTPGPAPRYDLTAGEAGALAARAGARRLLLTHFWPGADRTVSAAEAGAAFPGAVLVAEEGQRIALR